MRWRAGLLVVLLAACTPGPSPDARSAPVASSRHADLDGFVRAVETLHPEPFGTIDERRWRADVAQVRRRAAAMTDDEFLVAVARLAVLGDGNGHGGVFPTDQPKLRMWPLRLHEFADGWRVVDAADPTLVGSLARGSRRPAGRAGDRCAGADRLLRQRADPAGAAGQLSRRTRVPAGARGLRRRQPHARRPGREAAHRARPGSGAGSALRRADRADRAADSADTACCRVPACRPLLLVAAPGGRARRRLRARVGPQPRRCRHRGFRRGSRDPDAAAAARRPGPRRAAQPGRGKRERRPPDGLPPRGRRGRTDLRARADRTRHLLRSGAATRRAGHAGARDLRGGVLGGGSGTFGNPQAHRLPGAGVSVQIPGRWFSRLDDDIASLEPDRPVESTWSAFGAGEDPVLDAALSP